MLNRELGQNPDGSAMTPTATPATPATPASPATVTRVVADTDTGDEAPEVENPKPGSGVEDLIDKQDKSGENK